MPDSALLALTWRVTRQRLAASPLALVAGLAFPAFVVWIGLHDSYDSAAKFFFFSCRMSFSWRPRTPSGPTSRAAPSRACSFSAGVSGDT